MSEPFWEPLGGLVPGPAGPQGPQGSVGTMPGRLASGSVSVLGNIDVNTALESGWYSCITSNLPPGVNHAHVHVVAYNTAYLVQTAYDLYSEAVFTRRAAGAGFGPWIRRTPLTGMFQTGAMSNDTQYGWNIWFPVAQATVPTSVVCTIANWNTNMDALGYAATNYNLAYFDLYVRNIIQGGNFGIRWVARFD